MSISKITSILIIFFLSSVLSQAYGWHNETHLAVAKAAGYKNWYNAAGADITKVKAGSIESANHYFNNYQEAEVTPGMVLKQINRYNNPSHSEGHLYGAILASLREYKNAFEAKKYAEYHFAFSSHYIADLSQPLHNVKYDKFNKEHHVINDGTVEAEVLKNMERINKHMYPILLKPDYFEKDLAKEISRIANLSRALAYKLKNENRDMTKKEAYIQLGHSASLLKAVLQHFKDN
jgi:predicted AlkP superfamily pyrophosphatase or phosphodiesterase